MNIQSQSRRSMFETKTNSLIYPIPLLVCDFDTSVNRSQIKLITRTYVTAVYKPTALSKSIVKNVPLQLPNRKGNSQYATVSDHSER